MRKTQTHRRKLVVSKRKEERIRKKKGKTTKSSNRTQEEVCHKQRDSREDVIGQIKARRERNRKDNRRMTRQRETSEKKWDKSRVKMEYANRVENG